MITFPHNFIQKRARTAEIVVTYDIILQLNSRSILLSHSGMKLKELLSKTTRLYRAGKEFDDQITVTPGRGAWITATWDNNSYRSVNWHRQIGILLINQA